MEKWTVERVEAGELFIASDHTNDGLIKGCHAICRQVDTEEHAEMMANAPRMREALLVAADWLAGTTGTATHDAALDTVRPYGSLEGYLRAMAEPVNKR